MQGPPLPPGWQQFSSPTGHPYFYHAASNTTQWHHPSYPPAPPGGPGGYPTGPGGAPGGYPGSAPSGYPAAGAGAAAPSGYPSAGGPSKKPHGKPQHGSSGAGGRYTYNQAMEFKLKEKAFSLSGDNFDIKNVTTGGTAFKVKGSVMSFQDKKKLLDANGNAIYSMVESIMSLRGRMQIVDASSKQPVVTLRKKGFIPMMGTSTVQVWRGGSDDGDCWISAKGDYLRKNFDIKEKATGRTLASVRRKSMNLSNLLLEKDTYVIRCEAGVDTALMVFLVIALDEQYRDDGNRTGLESRLGGIF